MSKKNKKEYIDSIVLPKTNEGIENFVDKNRVKMYLHTIKIIEQSIDSNCSIAEVYQFDGSNYSILINEENFKENVDFIFNELIQREEYELCSYVKTVKEKVDNMMLTFRTNYI